MNAKTALTIDSIFTLVLGIAMLFFHNFMLGTFGLSDNPSVAAVHLARTVGFVLIGLSIITWSLRNKPLWLVFASFAFFFTLDIINIILEISSGILNSLAWIMVILIGAVVVLNVWSGWSLYQSESTGGQERANPA